MPIKTDDDLVAEVMKKEQQERGDDAELTVIDSLVTPQAPGGHIVYVVYHFDQPAWETSSGLEVPGREGVRWTVRPPDGGGASGEV